MIAVLLAFPPIAAQPPEVAIWPGGYPPVPSHNVVAIDPYATVGVDAPWPWFGGAMVIPGTESLRDRLWLRAEYLRWDTEGMNTPPLAATSPAGTAQSQAAVLGQPGTSVLFGGQEINGSAVNGFRALGGFWIRSDTSFGIEAEYFGLASQNDSFFASGDGAPILGIPYFDVVAGDEASQLISYPGVVSGNMQFASNSELKSFLINGRAALVPNGMPVVDGRADRVDWLIGYRYLDLDDQLTLGQNLTPLAAAAPPGTRSIVDQFTTSNEFNGLQLGFNYQANFQRVWLESLLRIAVGNNTQKVSIAGSTSVTDGGTTDNFSGGLFAQQTNIGSYERKQFTMIPELGFTLGMRVTNWFQATVGYTLLYYPNVARAGDQISRDLNPTRFPLSTNPASGALRPAFSYVESDYWAQGISLGGEFRF
jgi:hypothetical protein